MSKILFGDTETTGLDPEKGHRICEIALIQVDLQSGDIIEEYHRYFNPQRSIDKKAQNVHGLSAEFLSDHMPLSKAHAQKINQLLSSSDVFVAHNADFDTPFIYDEVMRHVASQDVSDIEIFCTMENGRFAAMEGKLPNLKELCKCYGVEYDDTEAHSALYDTQILAEAFRRAYIRQDWHIWANATVPFPEYVAAPGSLGVAA